MELCVHWPAAIPRFLEDFHRFKEPPHYYITFPDLTAGTAITGGGYLFVGAAIRLWMEGSLTQPCPDCESVSYLIHAASLQSGTGYWKGCCPVCGIITSRERALEAALKGSLHGVCTRQLGYKPVLREENPYHFSFKDGLTRDGYDNEVRMVVPGWLEFMTEHYAECLREKGA